MDDLKRSFAESLEDYVEFCRSRGEQPEKPYSGHFMVRVEPALHRALAVAARREGMSLDKFVSRTLASVEGTAKNVPSRARDFTETPVL